MGVSDYLSQQSNVNIPINANSINTVFESIEVQGGENVGKLLFVNRGEQNMIFVPTDSVSFESIYLDGKEVLNYESKADSTVEIVLSIENEKGTLEFVYFDSSQNRYEETFEYVSDNEIPVLELDYVEEPSVFESSVLISGRVIDSYFDWDSFTINNQEVNRYGEYFEAIVSLDSFGVSNLNIIGRDISFNYIDPPVIGSLLFNDNTITDLVSSPIQEKSFNINLLTGDDSRVYNYVNSYDGFDLRRNFISRTESLPVQERQGIRSINFKGVEESSQRIASKEIVSVDSTLPQVNLVEQFGTYKLVIDGTLSEIESFDVKINGVDATLSSCIERVAVFSECYTINDVVSSTTLITVDVEDSAGNRVSQTFVETDAVSFSDLLPVEENVEIFFSGNDKIVGSEEGIIQGQIKSNVPLQKVELSDGTQCSFDDYNFVCDVLGLEFGENIVSVGVYTFANVDTDFDGIPDYVDNCPASTNSNQNDLDGDDIGDVCDTDLDGDSHLNDVDNCIDVPNDQSDIDSDGLGDLCDNDDDNDGHEDSVDNCPGIANPDQSNLDGDDTGDICDDSDGDSLVDAVDNCPYDSNFLQTDTDNNGLGDICDDSDSDLIMFVVDNCPYVANTNQLNSDSDSLGDICDFDDDNDGINDSFVNDLGDVITFDPFDNCRLTPNPLQEDFDNNGVGDACDSDLDGDGFDNSLDNCIDIPNDQSDNDNDGLGDLCDFDDDNDGINDDVDSCDFTVNIGDSDNDGVDDSCDDMLDSDGDMRPDSIDTCINDATGDHRDLDGDGFGNVCDDNDDGDLHLDNDDNCVTVVNDDQANNDGDDKGDVCDDDDDNDLQPDLVDNCVFVSNFDQSNIDGDEFGDLCDSDIDGDNREIDLGVDSCIYHNTGDHGDIDSDGLGNVCDDDDDNDGHEDSIDNCPGIANPSQEDFDNNGIGDNCDDRDGDGIEDSVDNCRFTPNFFQIDGDSNGVGDVCDDSDDDFVMYDTDNCPYVANTDQADNDNDGLGDLCDFDDDNDGFSDDIDHCQFTASTQNIDTDSDGDGDACDFDDDNDGIPDAEDDLTLVYTEPPSILFNDIRGTGVFKLSDVYHSVIPEIVLDASLNYPSVVRVLVGGVEYLEGQREGNFSINIDITNQIQGIEQDQRELEIYLEAENQIDEVGLSNTINLIYDRVLRAIVRVFVE